MITLYYSVLCGSKIGQPNFGLPNIVQKGRMSNKYEDAYFIT
jgi:hypothetical protein